MSVRQNAFRQSVFRQSVFRQNARVPNVYILFTIANNTTLVISNFAGTLKISL